MDDTVEARRHHLRRGGRERGLELLVVALAFQRREPDLKGAGLVGVNNRDLKTFTVDLGITERLAARAPRSALLVTESGLFTAADAARLEGSGAKAMLVGESLMRQADVEAATRALLGS